MIKLIYETKGTPFVSYKEEIRKLLEIWLKDNIKGEWKFGDVNASSLTMNVKCTVFIKEDEDAMAFKLRWC